MKNLFLLLTLLLALCSMHAYADHITVQGDVSGQWNTDTVLVAGDITVPNGQSLVIIYGTVVQFQGNFAFNVEGSVHAQGTNIYAIRFMMADTTGFGTDSIPDGGWRGIRFDHTRITNDSSYFSYCHFYNGKNVSDDPLAGNGGALCIDNFDKVSINHCLFQDNFATFNGGAIYLDSADVIIRYSTFTNNHCGPSIAPWGYGGAICSDHSNPDIRWNVFEGNFSTGVGGGLAVRFEDCNLYNNVFEGNTSGLGGGFGYLHIPECFYRVNNNLIVDNDAVYFGGGVANLDASPIYINNTIAYNQAMYGGGFYCKDSVSPDFYNTIFWGNQAGVGSTGYLFEVYSQADFFYSDVEGGPSQFGGSGGGEAFSGAYEHCIELDPEFFNYYGYPYQLEDGVSPCIDAGSPDTSGFKLPDMDLAELPRIWSQYIDMGAFESVWEGITEPKENGGIKVWPNPFRDYVNVEVEGIEGEEVLIEVFDIMGRKLSEVYQKNFSGENRFVINMNFQDFHSGMFYLNVTSGSKRYCSKLQKCFTQRSTE